MKSKTAKILSITLMALLAAAIAEPALAQVAPAAMTISNKGQSLGTVALNITQSLRGVSTLITMICYLGALVFGVTGAMKWKAYGEQPDRTPLKIPVTYWGIAILLAGFPEFLGTGVTTLWGSGSGGAGPNLVTQP